MRIFSFALSSEDKPWTKLICPLRKTPILLLKRLKMSNLGLFKKWAKSFCNAKEIAQAMII